jgi:hypothetical protein
MWMQRRLRLQYGVDWIWNVQHMYHRTNGSPDEGTDISTDISTDQVPDCDSHTSSKWSTH